MQHNLGIAYHEREEGERHDVLDGSLFQRIVPPYFACQRIRLGHRPIELRSIWFFRREMVNIPPKCQKRLATFPYF